MKAIWNGEVIAESNNTIVIENNHYFPQESLKRDLFKQTDTNTVCPWKGIASYYDIEVDGKVNSDAAWFYPDPKEAAIEIKNRVAFWKGVQVTE